MIYKNMVEVSIRETQVGERKTEVFKRALKLSKCDIDGKTSKDRRILRELFTAIELYKEEVEDNKLKRDETLIGEK